MGGTIGRSCLGGEKSPGSVTRRRIFETFYEWILPYKTGSFICQLSSAARCGEQGASSPNRVHEDIGYGAVSQALEEHPDQTILSQPDDLPSADVSSYTHSHSLRLSDWTSFLGTSLLKVVMIPVCLTGVLLAVVGQALHSPFP